MRGDLAKEQEAMKLRMQRAKAIKQFRVNAETIPAPAIATEGKPLCSICHRRVCRRNSPFCSRCTIKSVEQENRDKLPDVISQDIQPQVEVQAEPSEVLSLRKARKGYNLGKKVEKSVALRLTRLPTRKLI